MDKETRAAHIARRLRSLFLYYAPPAQAEAFYLVREAALIRAAASLADVWEEDPRPCEGQPSCPGQGMSPACTTEGEAHGHDPRD
jgi:hypothetical protein